jgi:hypothetical protein
MPDITIPDAAVPHASVPHAALPGAAAAPTGRFSGPLAVVTAAVVLLLAGTVMLWAHYGTAVFYETILAGIAACF